MSKYYRDRLNRHRSGNRELRFEALESRRVLSVAPMVMNLAATGVGASQATVNGEVTLVGSDTPNLTLYWGDESGGVTAANWDNSVSLGSQASTFSWNLAGLDPQTTYYYRVFAANSCGDDWADSVSAFITLPDSLAAVTGFNDYSSGGSTHPNATAYATNGTASGPVLNVNTGQATGITLTTENVGASFAGSQSGPSQNTDAHDIFNNFVDFGSGGIELNGNDTYTYRYSGLEANNTYEFAGTAIRGNQVYTDRWTLVTLVGADSFTAAHSAGDGVVTSGLAPNQAAVWFGGNEGANQGFVAQWTNIDPGSDGEFEIVSSQYTGSVPTSIDSGGVADGTKGYAPSGTRLIESAAGFTVLATDPAPAQVFATAPVVAEIDFSVPVDPATISAGDLTFDGVPALAFSVTDADTVRWILPSTVGSGESNLEFAAGSILSSSGESLLGFSSPFVIATTPAIANTAASAISSTSALAVAEVLSTGFDSPDVLFYWGDNDAGTNAAAWDNVVAAGKSDLGTISAALSGMSSSTTYYYRAFVSNVGGSSWAAATESFMTAVPGVPGVAVSPASSVGPFSAAIDGAVNSNNDATNVTLYYGFSDGGSSPTNWDASVDLGVNVGLFDFSVLGLAPQTQYFYRALATNSAGSAWSNLESLATTSIPPIVINEIGSGESDLLETRTRINTSVPFDGSSSTPDWIELYNPTGASVDLAGFHLTDDLADDDQWTFPQGTTIPANGYLVVYASADNLLDTSLDETGRLHTNFKLNDSGEYLALNANDGSVLYAYSPEFSRLYEGFTVGRNGVGAEVSFATPTPGATNDLGSIVNGFVADTAFSIDRGFFSSAFSLQITSPTPAATIVYTTDGSEPTLSNGTQVPAANGATPPVATLGVNTTTVVRARAYRTGWVPTNIDTHSYIFISDVINQSANPSGFPNSWGGAPAVDYGVDPQIANDPSYTQDLIDGLRELPTISITSNVNDLFGAAGLYSNTNNSNLEVVASAELIYEDGSTGFQLDSGLKLQGGASRNPNNSPKHALSLRFRDAIADGKLEHALYDSAVTKFDSLHLRSRYNNSWIHWSEAQRERGTLLRDEWVRDSLLDMGNEEAGHGKQVHVYLNGLYWGVYSLEERPDAAHYAEYNGGSEDDYDALNGGAPIDGDLISYNAMKSTAASGNWTAIQQVLDVDNFIDFTMIQQFARNNDLKVNGNWRAAGGGANNAPWQFYSWDSERSIEGVTEDAVTVLDPSTIFDDLMNVAEFKIRFADRVQMHFFNDGALTPAKNTERWNERADELMNAIVAESARWGDYRRDVHQRNCGCDLYERDEHWLPEVDSVANTYFPQRTSEVLTDYINAGYFPSVSAPPTVINNTLQHGGQISVGADLSFISGANVYYTTDGSDPRAVGGGISGTLYRPGIDPPINLTTSTTINARRLSGSTWSALNAVDFVLVPASDSIVVTEINYHPYAPTAAEIASDASLVADDFEFIEVTNTHPTVTVNVLGMEFVDGVTFAFPSVALAPGARAVIVEDTTAFQLRYGASATILGEWSGKLSNSGESLELVDGVGNLMLDVEYGSKDEWPESPDGVGATLVWTGEFSGNSDPGGKHYSWLGSREFGGTPGTAPAARSGVVINEVRSNPSSSSTGDAIELYNTSTTTVNIGGWYLSDAGSNLFKYQIPAGTILAAGEYVVFDESQFNPNPALPTPADFGLSGSAGDDVWLTVSDGNDGVAQFVDDVHFGATFPGETLARVPDATGRLAINSVSTLGCFNHPASISEVVISEINYSPADEFEFVEISNQSVFTVDLANWQLRGGVDFDFVPGTTLAGGGSLVVASFDPADPLNAGLFASFVNHYGGASISIVGGYSGKLSNSGEPVRLNRPGQPSASSPAFIPRVTVDEVVYDDSAPWATPPDTAGISLNRASGIFFGNEPAAWIAGLPTPGAFGFSAPTNGDLTGDGQVTAADIDVLTLAMRDGLILPALDLNGDASIDRNDVVYLVETTLGSFMGDANLDGSVDNLDFDIWNANRFGACSHSWGTGDFNGDLFADVSDLNIWNSNKFSVIAAASAIGISADDLNDDASGVEEVSNWQNELDAKDVNGDGVVSPLDALIIINELNSLDGIDSTGALRTSRVINASHLDVNGDGTITPLDSLLVVNRLNALSVDLVFGDGDEEDGA